MSNGIDPTGDGIEVVNCIIHDCAQGTFWSNTSHDALFYGNIFYNIGWINDVRGSGHCIYSQNYTGIRTIKNNLLISGYGWGIHAYGSLAQQGYVFDGNIQLDMAWLIGGSAAFDDITIKDNITYRTRLSAGDSINNAVLYMTNNIAFNPDGPSLEVRKWRDATVRSNILWSGETGQQTTNLLSLYPYTGTPNQYIWDNNIYYYTGTRVAPFGVDGTGDKTYSNWKIYINDDEQSTYVLTKPADFVRIIPNDYDTERAAIVIWNGNAQADSVNVDLSSLSLIIGATYKLHNAQNYLTDTTTFVYSGGIVAISMINRTVAIPIGAEDTLFATTFPDLGVFILEKV